jgi:hypothetical protein
VINVEIKIDTKKDSPDDIKKTIEFLRTLVGASSSNGSEFNTSSDATSAMVTMFGDTPVLNNDMPKAEDDEDSEDNQEEEKEKIELIPY